MSTASAWTMATLKAFAGLTAAVLAATALAQDPADPPGRVGRVSDFAGTVHLAPEDRPGEWGTVGRNYPVTSGDNLWVTPDGRVEVDFGTGQFRLAGDANVFLSRLDDREFDLFVANGRVIVRLRALENGEVATLATPQLRVRLNRAGLYRVDVDPGDATTRVTVRSGDVDLELRSGIDYVVAGQTAVVRGDDSVQIFGAQGYDGFDSWSASRDQRIEQSRSLTYVPPSMIGAYDLDDYGYWRRHGEYGYVWYPRSVTVDWAPYRFGRWVWVAPWGWTWVDNAPWGFAPFHYGRWVSIAGRWAWAPGPYVSRPVYAPALVAWYGGPNWSIGINVGGPVYGWVPLGWGDAYWPHYRVSTPYWRALNRPYAVNYAERPAAPPTRFANWNVPGAVTAVPGEIFTGNRPVPVASNAVRLPPGALSRVPVLAAPPVSLKPLRVQEAPQSGLSVPSPASEARSRMPVTAAPPGRERAVDLPGIAGRPGPGPAATEPGRMAPLTGPQAQEFAGPRTGSPRQVFPESPRGTEAVPQRGPAPLSITPPATGEAPTAPRAFPPRSMEPGRPSPQPIAPSPQPRAAEPAFPSAPREIPVPPRAAEPARQMVPREFPVPPRAAEPARQTAPQMVPVPAPAPRSLPPGFSPRAEPPQIREEVAPAPRAAPPAPNVDRGARSVGPGRPDSDPAGRIEQPRQRSPRD